MAEAQDEQPGTQTTVPSGAWLRHWLPAIVLILSGLAVLAFALLVLWLPPDTVGQGIDRRTPTFAVPVLVVGAGLLVLGAFSTRLIGEQTIGPGGTKLNLDDPTANGRECVSDATAILLVGRVGQFNDKYAFRRRVLEDEGVVTNSLRSREQVDAALIGRIALDGGFSWVGDADDGALPVVVLTEPPPREAGALWTGRDGGAVASPLPQSNQRPAARAQLCECGCGEPVRREFLPGHDAKLRSRLLKEAATCTSAANELRRRGWVSS